MISKRTMVALLATVGLTFPAVAMAQDVAEEDMGYGEGADTGQPDAYDDDTNVPPAAIDPDPDPELPGPEVAEGPGLELETQAGVGGTVAYAEAGVIELGGFARLWASEDVVDFALEPTFGVFVVDNLEVSALVNLGVQHISDAPGDDTNTTFAFLVEPSYHLPFTDRLLGFVGLGLGPAYNADDWGFALRPRLGLDILLGRSGILKPAFDVQYTTSDIVTERGDTLIGVNVSYGFSIGYTIML